MENDRKRDLLERDAFAQRLIKKDKDKRKNVAEKSDKRAYEEAAKRLAIEAENRESLVNDLRKESRRTHLSKRKEDKLNELKDDIMDDEFLFDEDQLTEKEKAERRYKNIISGLYRNVFNHSYPQLKRCFHISKHFVNVLHIDQYLTCTFL